MNELKPCPFCGITPALGKGKQTLAGRWLWLPRIKCRKCNIVREGEIIADLVAWWNTRAYERELEAAIKEHLNP